MSESPALKGTATQTGQICFTFISLQFFEIDTVIFGPTNRKHLSVSLRKITILYFGEKTSKVHFTVKVSLLFKRKVVVVLQI